MEILTNLKSKKVILASKSPRRQQLIQGLGIDVEIRTKEVEESFSESLIRQEVAMYLADKKAKAFEGELATDEILITGDTIVCLNDLILNKPEGTEDAKRMLRLLSGKTHTVITGVCIADNNRKELFYDATEVTFGELTDAEIAYYIEKHKPFDKAGSYGAQDFIGFIGIQGMNGSYYNVMGFPLHKVYEVLKMW
ncbi:MAG: Maf family nucleotide pyrophosphatase [Flavobacteriales bacterium]|nr:Maf family nucleotide pyrophosphatase [Flavobacteriales bacterium]MDG2246122.1 Maf family nucleotide pyrophosphatase [Flavobacteriales bacterium]